MLRLIWEFFKTGLFAVGGGMATFPYLQRMAEKYSWFTSQELMDMIAISESTPGAIGINCATLAGNKAYGLPGGILASLALITPAILIILVICRSIDRFMQSKWVEDVFSYLRPATAGLILGAMFPVIMMTLFNLPLFQASGNWVDFFQPTPIILFILFALLLKAKKDIHPLLLIGMGAACGIIFKL